MMSDSPGSPISPIAPADGSNPVAGTTLHSNEARYASPQSLITPQSDATLRQASTEPPTSIVQNTNVRERRFKCQQCDRAFNTSGHLARHTRIHTGERNHKCPYPGCETRCSRQDNLQQHYRIHLSPGSRRSAARDAAGRRRRRGSSAASNSSVDGAMPSPFFTTSGIVRPSGAHSDYPEPPITPPALERGRPLSVQLSPLFDHHPLPDGPYYHGSTYASNAARRTDYGFFGSEGPLQSIRTDGSGTEPPSAYAAQRMPSIYPSGHHQQISSNSLLSHGTGVQTGRLDAGSNHSMTSSSYSHLGSPEIHPFHLHEMHSPPLSSDSGFSTPEFPTTPHSANSLLSAEGEANRRARADYMSTTLSDRDRPGTQGTSEAPVTGSFSTADRSHSHSSHEGFPSGLAPMKKQYNFDALYYRDPYSSASVSGN